MESIGLQRIGENLRYFDSGCSSHMTGEEEKFEELTPEVNTLSPALKKHTTQIERRGKISISTSNEKYKLNALIVKQRGHRLLRSGQWSDCSFLVSSEPHQVLVLGHQVILARASRVFEAMFKGGMAERNVPIPISDVQPGTFKALLEYIYTDNIGISSFDKACKLCYGAKNYMLPHLVNQCTGYLWSNLNTTNACRLYELASFLDESVLMDKCIQIISTNTNEVLRDSSFEKVKLNTVITVFSLEHLNVANELPLITAAKRYVEVHPWYRRQLAQFRGPGSPKPITGTEKPAGGSQVMVAERSAESSPQGSGEGCSKTEGCKEPEPGPSGESQPRPDAFLPDQKPTIRSAIEKIRFLTLTYRAFVESPARSSLLTESEYTAVCSNIASSSSDVAMPSGFSTRRDCRKRWMPFLPPLPEPNFVFSEGMNKSHLKSEYLNLYNEFLRRKKDGTLCEVVVLSDKFFSTYNTQEISFMNFNQPLVLKSHLNEKGLDKLK